MALYAISDLHVSHAANREVVAAFEPRPGDWLALAGDTGETADDLRWTLEALRPRFAGIAWTPGNHDLWAVPEGSARGERRYLEMVEVCRALDVRTPEDPFAEVDVGGETVVLAPVFLLYDYTFRRDGETKAEALAAARASRAFCADEMLLPPDPYPSREAWCHARVEYTAARLAEVPAERRTVLVGHFPLRQDVVRLPRIPRFSPWCGTRLTEDWHLRYRAGAAINGHLHVPGTLWRDGVPFMEVSLGYPGQWAHRGPELRAPREVALAERPAGGAL